MKERLDENVIVVFPNEKNNNSLKQYAKLVVLFDDPKRNKNTIIKKMNQLGVKCINANSSNSNSDIVKRIESGNYMVYDEYSISDFLSYDVNITLYFRAFEEQDNHNLFIEEILCPFVLFRARGFHECMLVILPDNAREGGKPARDIIQDISNPISRYMYYESLCEQTEWQENVKKSKAGEIHIEPTLSGNDYYDQCFIYMDSRAIRLTRNFNGSNKNIVNVMPLIKLDYKSYAILSQSVEECFGDKNKFGADWIAYDLYDEIGECFHEFGEENILNSKRSTKKKYWVTNLEKYQNCLLTAVMQSICVNSLRSFEGQPQEHDITTVFDICGHMSMLAFLFFTSYCKEVEKQEWISWENSAVTRLVNLSQDYADGILQIMENAKEYADAAYMNYHIIDIEVPGRAGIKKRYWKYFDSNKDIKFFLQIQIMDMGKSDIVSTFVKSNKISDQVDTDADLQLKDFFTPLDDSCKEEFRYYYKDVRNITHHYGLRQFVSMIQSGKGYFEVISTQKSKVEKEERYANYPSKTLGSKHVPGTEYKIFLPVQYAEKAEQKAVGIGAQLDYKDVAIKSKWECKVIGNGQIVADNPYLGEIYIDQQDKLDKIEQLANYLSEKNEEGGKKRKIICIDVNCLGKMWQIEILTKALLLYVAGSNNVQRIALYNATRSFMMNFTRYLCNFYNNIAGIVSSSEIADAQIYVCKDDYSIDLGFMGNSLMESFIVCDYLARTRGVFNECLELIQSMVRSSEHIKKSKAIRFAPFDLLINLEEGSLFEERVKSDLQKDIQEVAFGCCLHDAHMRVGSKMHITDKFFDATLLFASGYYTSRFAYILSRKIAVVCSGGSKKLTLVGYENFSELLLTETRRLLNEVHRIRDVDYVIFEQGVQNEFKFVEEDKKRYADREFIVIVPVGCTLTTHSKIESEIRSNIIQDAVVLMNLTVIVIRSEKVEDPKETEKAEKTKGTEETKRELLKAVDTESKPRGVEERYWRSVDISKRVIVTKITNPKEVYYNVLLSSKWENPLICSACFPPVGHSEREKPMLTMSYTSAIPMVLIGLKKQYGRLMQKIVGNYSVNKEIEDKLSELKECVGSIDMLRESMIYGHVENGSNHFEYYFETELLMKKIYETQNDNRFSGWVDKLKEIIQAYNRIICEEQNCEEYIYDILVAPMNRTNATFVEHINMHAFENVPIIVYIDANREFRDNIKTKYSNLTALYYNLMISNKRAVINFHYIDDCIVSGTTFYRTKSLLQSLFPAQAFMKQNRVYVEIFQNVILLVNRCSNSTKLNYAGKGHFFAYIDVHISSMRTHHDKACVLCENENNYKLLRDCSSTNKMAEEWNRKLTKNAVKSIEKSREVYMDDSKGANIRDRHYRRLYCANYLSDQLDRMGDEKNNTEKVRVKILEIINQSLQSPMQEENLPGNLELIISYFKVAARPFIVFRKSVLEAIFAILIETLESWGQTSGEDSSNISMTINKSIDAVKSDQYEEKLLECLEALYRSIIALLSSLGSKYLVRKDSYDKLINNAPMRVAGIVQNQLIPFDLFYAAHIKRMITLNKDETIGLWFENLLINGYEAQREGQATKDTEFLMKFGINSDFGKMLFLENTYIIFQTVSLIYAKICRISQQSITLDSKIEIVMNNFEDAYYYENYRSLFQCGCNDWVNPPNLQEETKQMVLLFAHLKENVENDRNVIDYYKILAEEMKQVSGANNVLIYGCRQFGKEDDVYEIAGQVQKKESDYKYIVIDMSQNRDDNLSSQLQENIIICEEQNYVVLKVDNNSEWCETKNTKKKDCDYSDNIFCVFEYGDTFKMKDYEVLRRMRNILVFRHTMMERFRNDFHNNAFKVFMDQKHRNELIASIKAVSHTSNDTLKYVTQEMEYMSRNDLNIYAAYMLQLATDSLISRLYVESIQDNVPTEPTMVTMFDLTDSLMKVLENLHYYSDGDSIDEGTYTGLCLESEVKEKIRWETVGGEQHYSILFITAVFYNALQHGLADKANRKIRLKIFQEVRDDIHYLCFQNMTRHHNMDDFNKNMENGITLKALEYYFKHYLGREIVTKTTQQENGISFQIDLPVYQERSV